MFLLKKCHRFRWHFCFINLCEKVLECIRDNFYLEAGDLRLYVEYCRDVCLFNISLKSISGNKLISEIYIKENAFEDFIYELKRMKADIIKSLCKVKVGNKIRILTKEEMCPNFIDEIGRLHFDLGDGSDIIFNKDMEKYCGAEGKITVVNPFIDLNGNVKLKTRLVDCVGYLVNNAIGYLEDDMPRMVKTPWSENEMPFETAAELGTKKVIDFNTEN